MIISRVEVVLSTSRSTISTQSSILVKLTISAIICKITPSLYLEIKSAHNLTYISAIIQSVLTSLYGHSPIMSLIEVTSRKIYPPTDHFPYNLEPLMSIFGLLNQPIHWYTLAQSKRSHKYFLSWEVSSVLQSHYSFFFKLTPISHSRFP